MNSFKLYISLAQLSGYIGLGVVMGALLSDGANNTPYWVGGILVFAGSVLLGMSISTKTDDQPLSAEKDTTDSSDDSL